MQGLVLHCGANAATREQVNAVAVPEATETWHPIPHLAIRDLVVETLVNSGGYTIVEEAYGLWKDGLRAFGLLGLSNGASHGDYQTVLGWRNSHDKSFPAAGAIGSRVFVCDNLAFSGEITFARKHTVYVLRDLPQIVHRVVARLVNLRGQQEQRIETYKRTEIGRQQAHDLIINALDARAVAVTRIPEVLSQWRTPQHEEFSPRTLWSLFNSFTEVEKGSNLFSLSRRTQALYGVFDQAAGLMLQPVEGMEAGHIGDAVREEDVA